LTALRVNGSGTAPSVGTVQDGSVRQFDRGKEAFNVIRKMAAITVKHFQNGNRMGSAVTKKENFAR
jgi:hypothetical protein